MKSITSSNVRVALGSALASALLLSASVSFADDTEIFFGGPTIDAGIRPNVLFILDNSGSMQWRTDSNSNPSGSEQSRMQILKESFASIISSAGNINAGIMALNERSAYNNTRMVYPVTNINSVLAATTEQVASTPQILESGDDATQRTDIASSTVTNANVLFMGNISTTTSTVAAPLKVVEDNDAFFIKPSGGNDFACRMDKPNSRGNGGVCTNDDTDNINIRPGTNSYVAPLRAQSLLYFRDFDDINTAAATDPIPQSAASDPGFTAYLDLRPTQTQSTLPIIQVSVEQSKTPAAPNDNSQLGARTYLASVNLTPTLWNSAQNARLDITALVKNVLAANPQGNALQGLLIKLRATNNIDYSYCARNCGSNNINAPRVSFNYSSTATQNESRMGGLRFQNVGIPQGATVTSARLDFAPAADNAVPVTFAVKAEKTGDASIFTSSTNLTSRTKTSAVTSWVADPWVNANPAVHVQGPNVTNQVQEVVSQSSWCGNNAMAFYLEPNTGAGSRTAHSIDGAPGLQPTLTITYTGGAGGCLNPIIETSVATAKDDAFQASSNQMILDGLTLPVDRSRFAARYTGLPFLNGATVLDAQVILTPANTVSIGSPITTTVRFENAINSAPFTGTAADISNRSNATNSTCSISNWTTGSPVTCKGSELRTSLQSILNQSLWAPGNALTVMSVQGSDSNLDVTAFETNPAQSIKLRVKVASGGLVSSDYTVRQHLNALVQAMSAGDGTPIVPTYYEAAQYLRGERSGFTSPITSACQPTHVVLLTDGQANGTDTTTKNGIASWAGSCSVAVKNVVPLAITDSGTTADSERCGRTLAEWMAVTDQSTLADDSFINMHTIGFALDALGTTGSIAPKKFLADLASNGQGGTYSASNASQLSAAFSDILQTVQSVDTTFVSASAPVNSFERADNQDELYFSLFRPKANNRWPGNLKRYRFAPFDSSGNLNPQIVDVDNVGAIDFTTGGFKSTSRSFWSTAADGNFTEQGGAAKQLALDSNRKLYTYISTSSPTSPATLSNLVTTNTAITNAMLSNAANDTERAAQFSYIRGLEPTDGSQRKAIGDPVHSSPRIATYSCITPNASDATKCDVPDQTAFIGTNEGFLQAFNTQTGEELFGYMPQELLGNIKTLMLDDRSTSLAPRPYGLDNPVTVWANDLNNDGKILASATTAQSGEFVYTYASMGRGGRNIYAMDVTNRSAPKLLWYIKGGVTPGFAKLGQTWSAPIKSKIDIGGTITDVLVFAGGYDELQDEASNANTANLTGDTMGNAIYVVNAKTGSLIWSASSEASNASASQGHRQMAKMLYSIPSNVRLIDLQTSPTGTLTTDDNKLADQIFVGDVGGQVWRFYINNGSSGVGLITAGGTSANGVFATAVPANFATLDATNKLINQRRFYNVPEVALMKKDGHLSLSVNIGSGYRGHPLKTETVDRFYSFRTSNLVDPAGTEGTLQESDLLDLTTNLTPTTTSEKLVLSGAQLKGGWFFKLPNSGEKVLTRALTTDTRQIIFFNTYQPSANTSSCEPTFGTSRSYEVSLYDASPIPDANGDPTPRFSLLSSPGIPPQPEEICIGDNCFVITGPGTNECDAAGICKTGIKKIFTPPPGLMYWIDETDPGA